MTISAIHQAFTDAFSDALLAFRCFFSFTFRLFGLRLILVGGKGFITSVAVRLGCCPEPIHNQAILSMSDEDETILSTLPNEQKLFTDFVENEGKFAFVFDMDQRYWKRAFKAVPEKKNA